LPDAVLSRYETDEKRHNPWWRSKRPGGNYKELFHPKEEMNR